MKKRYLISAGLLLLFFLFAPRFFQAKADHFDPLPTEFTYSEAKLSQCRSSHLLTLDRIAKWDEPLQYYFKTNDISYLHQLYFYTYLYLAQRDAVFLSYNVQRCFVGSLDPLTKEIVVAFFPDFTDFPPQDTDPYSEMLAKEIWIPYRQRLEKEQKNTRSFSPCFDQPVPEKIQQVAKWTPWITPLPKVPPPSCDLEGQIAEMQRQRRYLNEEEKNLAYAWAGEKGMTRYWWALANEYMYEKNTPIGQAVYVRSLLMIALFDSVIAVFDAKYTYCIPRPAEADASVQTLVHNPRSPSYPSGHAAQAGAAEVILSHFFSKDAPQWRATAEGAAESRIWAGVHTPQDAREGLLLGKEVGTDTLNAF